MRRIFCIPLLFIAGCIVFTSCQKDFEDTANRPNPGNNEDLYIDTVYEYSADYPDGPAFTYVYNYDALKRVSEIRVHSTAEGPVYDGNVVFTYDGNNMQPSSKKLIGYAILPGTNEKFFDTSVNYYFYTNENLIRDSMIYSENNSIGIWGGSGYRKRLFLSKFEYQGSNFFIHHSIDTALINLGNTWPTDYTADSVFLDANGNVLRSLHYQGVPWEIQSHSFTETFTYDTKPNPFKKLNIYKTLNKLSHEWSQSDGFQSVNNVIQTLNESTGGTIDYPVTNIYRQSDGLLEKVIIPYDYYPDYQDRDSIIFTYKKL